MQGLDTLIGFAHHLLAHQGLLPHLVGAGNLFGPGTVHSLVLLGHGGSFSGIGLGYLGADFRRVDDNQRISLADCVSFLGAEFLDTARNFARYTVLGGFGLSLNHNILGTGNEVSDDGNGQDDAHQGHHADEKVVIFLCHSIYLFICYR